MSTLSHLDFAPLMCVAVAVHNVPEGPRAIAPRARRLRRRDVALSRALPLHPCCAQAWFAQRPCAMLRSRVSAPSTPPATANLNDSRHSLHSYAATGSRTKAVLLAFASGLSEPFGEDFMATLRDACDRALPHRRAPDVAPDSSVPQSVAVARDPRWRRRADDGSVRARIGTRGRQVAAAPAGGARGRRRRRDLDGRHNSSAGMTARWLVAC